MKLEVWNEPEPKEEEPTRVRLRPDGSGTVELCAVDAEGHRVSSGTIGSLSSEGLTRYGSLSPDLGFPLDEKGRILDV